MSPKTVPSPCLPAGVTDPRIISSFEVRLQAAAEEAKTPVPAHTTNGDEEEFADKCGTYTKCIRQIGPGLVDLAAFQKFREALGSADGATPGSGDFESVTLGGMRPLNGPLASFAFTMAGADSVQFGMPVVLPAPKLESKAYATELVELYWASLLRDVPFAAYETDKVAQMAADELDGMSEYAGPRDAKGKVTPRLLFRGGLKQGGKSYFADEISGPYISQFAIRPTTFGTQPIDQLMRTFAEGVDYMTDLPSWEAVQNGMPTGLSLQPGDRTRYLHTGRGLAAYTHEDELYEAYFIAYLVMNTLKIPRNPSNPYSKFKAQQPFGTFGGPDIAATLAAVAKAALNACWYQKWVVHLRHRPESGGGIVQLIKTGKGKTIQGKVDDLVLHSKALEQSHDRYKSFLLSQPFPEGSPAHPAYPTGHGTVAGACITVLKFFYDGTAIFPDPKVPSKDGLMLEPYSYSSDDGGLMTVNGELHKLAHNISFGHGTLAGIHWRSDTDSSILLGEAVALAFLRDQARTYKEKFSVDITKLDGSKAMISN